MFIVNEWNRMRPKEKTRCCCVEGGGMPSLATIGACPNSS